MKEAEQDRNTASLANPDKNPKKTGKKIPRAIGTGNREF